MDQIGFHLPAEVLEVYKIKIASKMEQGHLVTEVSCELLIAPIERTQAWMRLESDEKKFQEEKQV